MEALRQKKWISAAFIALAACFLLAGYEFVRSASNTLFKNAYGKGAVPVIMAITPLGVLAILFIYGRLLSWIGPRRTIGVTSICSAAAIALATWGAQLGWKPATGVLYIVREAYIVLLIEQYWSFLNSTLGAADARRLNGPITGVASIGSIIGGLVAATLASNLGTAGLPIVAALTCIPAAACSYGAYMIAGEPKPGPREALRSHDDLALKLFGESRLLMLLLLVIVVTQVISGMLDWRFQIILSDAFKGDPDGQTAYSSYFFGVKIAATAAVLQFIVTPLLLRFVPLRAVHAVIPCIHLLACATLFAAPSLVTAGAALLLFKSFDYSIFRAAKELLYLPLSFDARYRAKEVIDVFGYRFSKGAAALTGILFTGAWLSAEVFSVALATLASAGWLLLVTPLMRAYKKAATRSEDDAAKSAR